MAQSPALSAVDPDLSGLGPRYRARALRPRPRAADRAVLLPGDIGALAGIQFNKGDVMFAAALLAFGLYSALMPRRPKTHQLSLISFTMCCGALLLLPFSLWEFSTGFTLKFDLLTVATLIYVVIFPSTLAYLFFNRGIALIGPNRAAPFLHLVPVFGSAMAILLLGEQPRLFHLVGYLLVLAGVGIAAQPAVEAGGPFGVPTTANPLAGGERRALNETAPLSQRGGARSAP